MKIGRLLNVIDHICESEESIGRDDDQGHPPQRVTVFGHRINPCPNIHNRIGQYYRRQPLAGEVLPGSKNVVVGNEPRFEVSDSRNGQSQEGDKERNNPEVSSHPNAHYDGDETHDSDVGCCHDVAQLCFDRTSPRQHVPGEGWILPNARWE